MNVLEAKLVMDSLGNIDQKLPREENAKTVNLPAFRELVEATRNIPGTATYRAKIEQHPYYQSKVAARAFGWQLRKPDRQREKEIARHQPAKMLGYAGEKTWREESRFSSGACGRTGSQSGTFGIGMAAGQGGAGTGARVGGRT